MDTKINNSNQYKADWGAEDLKVKIMIMIFQWLGKKLFPSRMDFTVNDKFGGVTFYTNANTAITMQEAFTKINKDNEEKATAVARKQAMDNIAKQAEKTVNELKNRQGDKNGN